MANPTMRDNRPVDKVEITAVFPGGREIKGVIPHDIKGLVMQELVQIWSESGESWIINLKHVESAKIKYFYRG